MDWRDAGLDVGATARGLVNGVVYVFEVRAENAKGAGPAASASATPATGVADDLLAKAWLARFGRLSAGHVIGALEARFMSEGRPPPRSREPSAGTPPQRRSPNTERVRHRGGVGGRATDAAQWDATRSANDWQLADDEWSEAWWAGTGIGGGTDGIWASEGSGRSGTESLRDLVRGMLPGSFHLSATPTGGTTRVSAWGRLTTGGFEGADALASVDGRVRTLTLGGDVERGALLAGLAVSRSSADGGFEFLDGRGGPARPGDDAESVLTGLYPYVRFDSGRLSVWGVAGNAEGSLSLTGSGVDVAADVTAGMGALGARGVWLGTDRLAIALKSDLLRTWLTSSGERLDEVEAAVNRARMLLEASATTALAGGRLTSALELGVRHDSGTADTGSGFEVAGRLRFAGARRLTLAAEGRAVAMHGADSFGEWGLSGSVLYMPRASGAGASLRLAPAWGTSSSDINLLLAEPQQWLRQGTRPAFGVDAEFGYGFRMRRSDGVAGPYVALGYHGGNWTRRAGWRLTGGRLDMDGSVVLRDAVGSMSEMAVLLRASMNP